MSNHYVTAPQLRAAIQNYRDTGILSPELTDYLQKIAVGVANKYGKDHLEDAIQETWILFLRHMDKVKLDASPFNYLSSIAHNACRHAYRKQNNRTRLMHDYYQDLKGKKTLPEADHRSFK
jgi:RNA polymerase sigma factor (sigma-70 family)